LVRWFVIAFFGLSAAASSSSASDEYAYSGLYFGIGASYASEHFSLDTDNLRLAGTFGSGVDPSYDDSAGVDVQVGYRLDEFFAVEFLYGFLEGFDSTVGFRATEIDLHLITLNAKFFVPVPFLNSRLEPYLLAGVGTQIVNLEVRDGAYGKPFRMDAGFVGRVGGGLAYRVTDWFSVEMEASTMLPAGGWVKHTRYSSVAFHFLRRF
jgi:opacity protein-like surface antigen